MNIDRAFSGTTYLKAVDLDDDLTLTIEGVELIEFDDGSKPMVTFQEIDKGFVLNKTNKNSIVAVLGTAETDDWVGKQITLFPTTVDFSGKQVEAIRVRLPRQLRRA
jgi:hypothetical protein